MTKHQFLDANREWRFSDMPLGPTGTMKTLSHRLCPNTIGWAYVANGKCEVCGEKCPEDVLMKAQLLGWK